MHRKMKHVAEMKFIGDEVVEKYVVINQIGPTYGVAIISAFEVISYPAVLTAACFFKLSAGGSAVVDIFQDKVDPNYLVMDYSVNASKQGALPTIGGEVAKSDDLTVDLNEKTSEAFRSISGNVELKIRGIEGECCVLEPCFGQECTGGCNIMSEEPYCNPGTQQLECRPFQPPG